MQLSRRTSPPPRDLSSGLSTRARELGQRPAVSVLRPGGRAEQGFVTLAQWAAKGAHLLEVDHAVGPGVHVHVDVPAGWPLAAVASAVWWTGGVVALGAPGDAEVAVVHERRRTPDVDEVLLVGDAVDGAPVDPARLPVWAVEVQQFPDHPPVPGAAPDGPAVRTVDGALLTHAQLVDRVAGGPAGPLGYDVASVGDDPLAALLAVAARPVVTGAATVVVDGVDRDAAAGDAVRSWWGD